MGLCVLTADDVLNIYNNGVTQDLNNFRIAPLAWYPTRMVILHLLEWIQI